ncbi:hypothetical protein CMK12_14135 [Candidatus Poribacteria bacterium]|nr:hypothetical protein [Candidatus Poribacteria bacterium]
MLEGKRSYIAVKVGTVTRGSSLTNGILFSILVMMWAPGQVDGKRQWLASQPPWAKTRSKQIQLRFQSINLPVRRQYTF